MTNMDKLIYAPLEEVQKTIQTNATCDGVLTPVISMAGFVDSLTTLGTGPHPKLSTVLTTPVKNESTPEMDSETRQKFETMLEHMYDDMNRMQADILRVESYLLTGKIIAEHEKAFQASFALAINQIRTLGDLLGIYGEEHSGYVMALSNMMEANDHFEEMIYDNGGLAKTATAFMRADLDELASLDTNDVEVEHDDGYFDDGGMTEADWDYLMQLAAATRDDDVRDDGFDLEGSETDDTEIGPDFMD